MPHKRKTKSRRRQKRKGFRRKGGNPNNPSLGQGGRPTLVMKAHQMLDASINTSTSFVRQITITPYLAVLTTALEQSKFYQQYRFSKV